MDIRVHGRTESSQLFRLFTNQIFTDLTVQVGGRHFLCHRVVLASASKYFYDELCTRKRDGVMCAKYLNQAKLCLPVTVKPDIFSKILRLIYTRSVNVADHQKIDFLLAIVDIGLYSSKDVFDQYIKLNDFAVEDAFKVIQHSVKNDDKLLIEACRDYIYKKTNDVDRSVTNEKTNTAELKTLVVPPVSKNNHSSNETSQLKDNIYMADDGKEKKRKRSTDCSGTNGVSARIATNALKKNRESRDRTSTSTGGIVRSSKSNHEFIGDDPILCESSSSNCLSKKSRKSLSKTHYNFSDGKVGETRDMLNSRETPLNVFIRSFSSNDSASFRALKFKDENKKWKVLYTKNCNIERCRTAAINEKIYYLCAYKATKHQTFVTSSDLDFWNLKYRKTLQCPPWSDSDYELCCIRDSIFVYYHDINIGWDSSDSNVFSDENGVYSYDMVRDCWYGLPPMKSRVNNGCIVSCNGVIYLVGGCLPERYHSVKMYDPRLCFWYDLAKLDLENGSTDSFCGGGAATCVLEDRIYVTGGKLTPTKCRVYDIRAKKWEELSNMNHDRKKHVLVTRNNQVWAIGGTGTLSIEVFDPKRNKWEDLTDMTDTLRAIDSSVRFHGLLDAICF